MTNLSRTLVDIDDEALAEAAAALGTSSKVETVNGALRAVAEGARGQEATQRFDELLDLLGETLAETDVRTEAWR